MNHTRATFIHACLHPTCVNESPTFHTPAYTALARAFWDFTGPPRPATTILPPWRRGIFIQKIFWRELMESLLKFKLIIMFLQDGLQH